MLLITGATGTIGRALVAEMASRDVKVRALTRNPGMVTMPVCVEVAAGDFTDIRTLADALTGVTSVFLNPAAVGEAAPEFLALARQHGVAKVVMLSSAAVRDDLPEQVDPLAGWHKRIEDAVTSSGAAWTILRCFEFASNVIQQWSGQIRYAGVVREPYGLATSSPIHERDVAAVAAEILLSDDHRGRTYPLTGPQSLTRLRMVEDIAQAIGRSVAFEEISPEQALRAMTENGLPFSIAESVLAMRAASVGHDAPVTPDAARLARRPMSTFAQWAIDHVRDFV